MTFLLRDRELCQSQVRSLWVVFVKPVVSLLSTAIVVFVCQGIQVLDSVGPTLPVLLDSGRRASAHPSLLQQYNSYRTLKAEA